MSASGIPGNFIAPSASKPMSSLSSAQLEAAAASNPGEPGHSRELELLRKAQRGDRAAYGQIVLAYQDRLFNAVLRLVGDREEASELTQEAFTRGLMKIDSFRGDAAPYTWLFRIALNLSISRLRKVTRRRTFSISAAPLAQDGQAAGLMETLAARDQPAPGDGLEKREEAEQVIAALGRLDAEYRAVLVMRDIEGLDYQQMADALNLPLGTLKSRLFRARLALRDELRSYMGEKS